jgi:PAS domain S-box-containing protein
MKRRSKAGEPAKARGRKAARRRSTPKPLRPVSSSFGRSEAKLGRLTNEALSAKIRLLETVLENSAESIYAKDKDGRYTYVNRVAGLEFGLMGEKSLGRTDFELFPRANAEEYRSNDLVAMKTRTMREHEVWWNDKIYLTRKLPLISRSGEIEGVCGITTDVTNLRRTELALREAVAKLERERDNKLMNVAAIMASIAHEVRQPLTAIATNGGAARRFLAKLPADIDEARANLDRIMTDCRRASEVFDGILVLFRRDERKRDPIDVNQIAREVLESSRGELADHGVTTQTELASELPLVSGHKSQLQQVVSNLVQNAIEAMDAAADRERVLRLKTGLHSGNAILVGIEDTGPGFDPKQMGKMFDAFFTTKSHGIGLGLAICRMIVERHGGELTATSDGKTGARFQFVLPAHVAKAARQN